MRRRVSAPNACSPPLLLLLTRGSRWTQTRHRRSRSGGGIPAVGNSGADRPRRHGYSRCSVKRSSANRPRRRQPVKWCWMPSRLNMPRDAIRASPAEGLGISNVLSHAIRSIHGNASVAKAAAEVCHCLYREIVSFHLLLNVVTSCRHACSNLAVAVPAFPRQKTSKPGQIREEIASMWAKMRSALAGGGTFSVGILLLLLRLDLPEPK